MKTKVTILLLLIVAFFAGCNRAGNVKYNLGQEADKFNVYRRVTVINLRSDKVLLEVEGFLSIKDSTDRELAIIINVARDEYQMHYVYTGSEVVYLVEQLKNTTTDPYHWKISIFAVFPEIAVG